MSKVIESTYKEEAVAGFSPRTAMEEASRCLLCHDAPCSQGCPAGTDPGKFIRSIRFRNVKGAAETIRENNPLGGSCARVCPYDRLCEEACSRCGIDRPIQIGKLQQFAIEQEKAFGMKTMEVEGSGKGKVACIGGGPASLSCAAILAQNGYDVTVYDNNDKAGGVLSYGIPPARLPQEVVDHDIDLIKDLGVKFELGKKIASVSDVKKDYDAVFVGVGLWSEKIPDIPGKDLDGVIAAADFLKQARSSGGSYKPGKKVVVIGGGDVSMDCAATAKLLGAEEVRIIYRRTIAEAPANMTEWQYCTSLGISTTTNFAPDEVIGSGKVEGMKFKGRDGKSELMVDCDQVVFAIGQGPEDMAALGLATTDKGLVKVDDMHKTSVDGVFAAGDIAHGGKTVVEAVAAGKGAAFQIMNYLA